MELRGAITILRSKCLDDAPREYGWRSSPELAELDAAIPLSISYSEFLRLFGGQIQRPPSGSRGFSIDTAEGVHVGNCMYYDIDTISREAEIGILIGDKRYWSMGYGYDVMVTLIDHIFSETSLRRLYLHTLQWNKRAQRCFAKCGFSPLKRVLRNGNILIHMELFKNTWKDIRAEKLSARYASTWSVQ